MSCPTCGHEAPAGSAFCNGCGGTLGAAPASAALEGERKQVTVLFADVKSSMELAQQIDPERWHVIPNRYFEILTEAHRWRSGRPGRRSGL